MVSVEAAEKIIQSQLRNHGTETAPFELALGRVLAEYIFADRDLPPFNRATMDGIAINFEAFENGMRSFHIKGTQAAGDIPVEINRPNECIEIMTGAALSATTDTVIRYEDVAINNGIATVLSTSIAKNQNIHLRGKDKKTNDIIAGTNQFITPVLINIAASVGKTNLLVKKLPKVIIISSGDELVEVNKTPSPWQIRRSNNYTIKAALKRYNVNADMMHIADDAAVTKEKISECLQHYDVIILSGGISMGKFDYIPQALKELSVQEHFHKIQQKPGKPMWFGVSANGAVVFALPGNPVSTFMCLHRYVIPWLKACLGLSFSEKISAVLDTDITFKPPLKYFLQVKLHSKNGNLLATPIEGNGSGDYASLQDANAFMELPAEQNNFIKGEVFYVWPFKEILF